MKSIGRHCACHCQRSMEKTRSRGRYKYFSFHDAKKYCNRAIKHLQFRYLAELGINFVGYLTRLYTYFSLSCFLKDISPRTFEFSFRCLLYIYAIVRKCASTLIDLQQQNLTKMYKLMLLQATSVIVSWSRLTISLNYLLKRSICYTTIIFTPSFTTIIENSKYLSLTNFTP